MTRTDTPHVRHPLRALATAFAAGAIVTLAACASKGPPPTSEMASARAIIAQAEAAGAAQSAPVELLAARENIVKAEAAVRAENYEPARRMAVRAEAEASVADRKARAKKAEMAVDEMNRSNDLLRQEIARKRGG